MSIASILTKNAIDREYRDSVGEFSYGAPFVHGPCEYGAKLSIGKFCSFGSGIEIYLAGEHNYNWVTTYPLSILAEFIPNLPKIPLEGHTKGNVVIGNDVWVGNGVRILSGVTIGDGAVIGLNSVVAKSIPPYAVAAGSPSRVVRYRFDEETIQRLLTIKWWDWPIEKITDFALLLTSNRIDEFLERNEM